MCIRDSLQNSIYLNALNIVFANNFLKLFSLLSSGKSAKEIWHSLNLDQKRNINPLKEWQRLQEKKINFILKKDKRYPRLLKEIPQAPFGFYIKGEIPEKMPLIAVVGTCLLYTSANSHLGQLEQAKNIRPFLLLFFTISPVLHWGHFINDSLFKD